MPKQGINFNLYEGNGQPLSHRNQTLPDCNWMPTAPKTYTASDGLRDAVNVAVSLGQPLLLTGEPGTGKTQLAFSVAHELELPLFEFYTKTTSVAKDLFYEYDTLSHFQDAHTPGIPLIKQKYVTYNAFGKAILLACTPNECQKYNPEQSQFIPNELKQTPSRSVVLIDEIDKAPRDLPNDILNDILTMSFTVKETTISHQAESIYRPIIILTSNSEKNLPEPFLRRCVYYHIDFPDDERLTTIIKNHMGELSDFMVTLLPKALDHFRDIRNKALKKPPATAELITWLDVLASILDDPHIDFNNLTPAQESKLAISYTVLAKYKDDLDQLLPKKQEVLSK